MRHTFVLYNEINKRAEQTFPKNVKTIAKDEWPEWYRHWLETTEKFRDEATDQGLLNTAAELNCIIAETRRDHAKDLATQ